jgi:hypothetical protein
MRKRSQATVDVPEKTMVETIAERNASLPFDDQGMYPKSPLLPDQKVTGTEEPTIAHLAGGLKKCLGIDLPLSVVAKWTPAQRADASNAIAAGGSAIAPWLDALRGGALFASANKGPGITPDFERIVESVYQVDAWREYEDLEKNLEVGDGRSDYGTVAKHLDQQEDRARSAHKLYLSAKLELLRFEAECLKVQAPMRERATGVLSDQKADGDRKKVITNADVDAKMAELYPDEFAHQAEKLAKLKGTVSHMERLADLHKNRCFTASTLLSTLRK